MASAIGSVRLNVLVDVCGAAAVKLFPRATPSSIAEHLRREVGELIDAPGDPEEAADCMLLLFHLAYKQGWDLESAILSKLATNMERTWGAPDAAGVVEHVEAVQA